MFPVPYFEETYKECHVSWSICANIVVDCGYLSTINSQIGPHRISSPLEYVPQDIKSELAPRGLIWGFTVGHLGFL